MPRTDYDKVVVLFASAGSGNVAAITPERMGNLVCAGWEPPYRYEWADIRR